MTSPAIPPNYPNQTLKFKKPSAIKIYQSFLKNIGIQKTFRNLNPGPHAVFQLHFNLLVTTSVLFIFVGSGGVSRSADGARWEQLPEILTRIVPLTFAQRSFYLTSYGTIANGLRDCTAASNQAIPACYESGGGRVIIPPEIFLTHAILLKSNVNLGVMKVPTIPFSSDPQKYLPVVYTRVEGVECRKVTLSSTAKACSRKTCTSMGNFEIAKKEHHQKNP
jgi:hypothetical protein